jgi:ATP-dependent helicase HrpA
MSTPPHTPSLAELRARLPELSLRDEGRLRRRLDGVGKIRKPDALATASAEIAAELARAQERVARRRESVPAVRYPEELPISQRRDDIAAAIRDSQVVIVAGETGSGKTTQLPKICLELGRGVRGMIGHTQPRRIAARTVAERVAEELAVPLGDQVGYQVRFTGRVGENTLVKLMTDGILLAETQNDRLLRQYDTLIIDEAHERSLNVDFLLGYLKQVLPRRPDLKLIITSATIDPQRFSRHFADAPVIEVSGRTYPVEVRYRPVLDPDAPETDPDRDQIQAICDAVEELRAERPGDVLVFLSGEREIRDTADALRRLNLRDTEILPLYARLSTAEQHRVFQPHPGRRIVLATNVAETSLTVPGIRYVVDPGTARISRYSHRLKVQRLPIEAISQASANQRKGRCGRLAEGICIRLYAEEDFLARPEFTEPEILRTNLASVILRMTALGLGDVEAFPFIDPPDRRQIRDGIDLLHELGALDTEGKRVLTEHGRRLAQLPVDPRLGRMILEADRNGCLQEVLVITSALSIQDPRERPVEAQQQAAEKHARFADDDSDFLTLRNLWRYLQEQQKALSSNQFRRMCRTEFLNYLRVREWQDLHGQLRQIAKDLGLTPNGTPAEPPAVHTALLAGLLSHIGLYDGEKRDYLGARGGRFGIFPGSRLFRKSPRWVMAAELVETSRLWARTVARIEPEWIEPLAGHLVKRNYSEPHWSSKQGAAMAYERVTLYGVPIVTQRRVNLARIDPALARELFIRHALVEGDWHTTHAFFAANRALLGEVEELEHRVRRRDILVDDQALFDLYDSRIPAEVVSARHFDSWWKRVRREDPERLTFDRSMLMTGSGAAVSGTDYPDEWRQGDLRLRLTYQFEPGVAADGVTVHIPLPLLGQVRAEGFDWQIPGLREELVTALLRSLPKQLRRNFVPVPDFAHDVRAALGGAAGEPRGDLREAIAYQLLRMTAVSVPIEAWEPAKLPPHLRITFRVEDTGGRMLAEGKDLAALKEELRPQTRAAIAAVGDGLARGGLRTWDFDELPQVVEERRDGYVLKAYPSLVDEGETVAVRLLPTEAEQRRAMWPGTRKLLLLGTASPAAYVSNRLDNAAKLALTRNPHGGVAALLADCSGCAVDKLVAEAGGPAWDAAGFAALLRKVRAVLNPTVLSIVHTVEQVLTAAYAVEQRLRVTSNPVLIPALTDIRAQLGRLVYPGFVTGTGWRRLPDLPRYLHAIERRLSKLPENPGRDRDRMRAIAEVQEAYDALPVSPEAAQIRWMIEELRVHSFAQSLGTPYPVSAQRIYRAIDDLAG